jgi:hypothetical protein
MAGNRNTRIMLQWGEDAFSKWSILLKPEHNIRPLIPIQS